MLLEFLYILTKSGVVPSGIKKLQDFFSQVHVLVDTVWNICNINLSLLSVWALSLSCTCSMAGAFIFLVNQVTQVQTSKCSISCINGTVAAQNKTSNSAMNYWLFSPVPTWNCSESPKMYFMSELTESWEYSIILNWIQNSGPRAKTLALLYN